MDLTEPWVLRIAKVVDYVQSHLDEELTPELLAEVAGFSLHHFHRVFRGITDESVMGFVRRLRLERAAQRLRFEATSVTTVALDSGYGSHEAFTRAFRARFGISPSAYRRREPRVAVDHDMRLRQEPDRLLLAHRYVGPYEGCGEAWGRMASWGAPLGVERRAEASVGLAYDDPEVTDASRLRYDAAYVVSEALSVELGPPPPGIVRKVIPGGTYAVATHRGPLDDILETYVALLGKWLPRRGVELSDEPVVEIYVRPPNLHPPEDLLTEVCVRVEPTKETSS